MFDSPPRDASLPPPSARLESLRGLAAMQVAMFHCLSVLAARPCDARLLGPAFVLFDGRAAVTLFFVLSGFVLGLSLRKSTGRFGSIYLRYAIRRGFRIYPTVFASTLVVWVCVMTWHRMPVGNTFLDHWIPNLITLPAVVRQLLLIQYVNPVTWTLRMELVCSLLLPLALAVERWRANLLRWILVGLVLLAFGFPTVTSVVVLPAFFLGFLLPSSYGWWQRMKSHAVWNAAVLLLGVVLLLGPRASPWPLPVVTLLEAMGAFAMIGTVVYGADLSIFKVLDFRFVRTAGKVSYSYYIYHPICLLSVAPAVLHGLPGPWLSTYPVLAAMWMWLLSSALAFPAAWVGYAWIERPFINCARVVCEAIRSPMEAARRPTAHRG